MEKVEIKLEYPFGDYYITLNEDGLFLTGPTVVVAEGRLNGK